MSTATMTASVRVRLRGVEPQRQGELSRVISDAFGAATATIVAAHQDGRRELRNPVTTR
jgi:hypothetical protein